MLIYPISLPEYQPFFHVFVVPLETFKRSLLSSSFTIVLIRELRPTKSSHVSYIICCRSGLTIRGFLIVIFGHKIKDCLFTFVNCFVNEACKDEKKGCFGNCSMLSNTFWAISANPSSSGIRATILLIQVNFQEPFVLLWLHIFGISLNLKHKWIRIFQTRIVIEFHNTKSC